MHDVGKEMFDRRHAVMLPFYTSNGHLCWPTSTVIFFDQHRWKIFICQDGLNFSWPNKWEHASFGRNKMSVELAKKNLADLHCTFFMQHQNKKTSSVVKKKNIIGQRAFLKKIAQCRRKNIIRATSRPMSAIEFSIQSLNEICMMSVRKSSIGFMRWCFFFTPRTVIFPGRRRLAFFSINIGEKYYFAKMV